MLFILGIERSATTWVSNLLEAHPATQVYVEPMSDITARFKRWPHRFVNISDVEEKARYFLSELKLLRKHKRWILTKFSQRSFAWKFDLWFSNWLVRKQIASEAATDFSEINFHRKAQLRVAADDRIKLEIIKELRLNFNAHLLSHIDPNAKVLVVVRNPFSTIQSILKHLEEGSLAELKTLLVDRYGEINEQTVYRYWRDSYSALLNTLQQHNIPYLLVHHTKLITDQEDELKKIFKFADLTLENEVWDYVKESNKQGEGIHNTNRNWDELLEGERRAQKAVLPKVRDVFSISDLHPQLQSLANTEN